MRPPPGTAPLDPADLRAALRRTFRTTEYWNHNTHYHRLLPRWAPPPWGRVLDVGCGEGLLTRRIAPFADEVVGVDQDATMLDRARTLAPDLTYVHGDALRAQLDGPFDLVTCVATLHHLGVSPGLERLRDLVAPGGTLVVVGLARPTTARDWLWSGVGVVANVVGRRRRGAWEPGAPVRDPAESSVDVAAAARDALPGVRMRRHLYWRYSLVWHAPGAFRAEGGPAA